MLLIPVIYVRKGKAVSPVLPPKISVDENVLDFLRNLTRAGIEMIHLVDLDLPPVGQSPNCPLISAIIKEFRIMVQVEANVKTSEQAAKYFTAGAMRLAVGNIAYQKPAFLQELCINFSGKILTHIDVRNNSVVIAGWTVATKKTPLDYASQFKDSGVNSVIFSCMKDGQSMSIEDITATKDFCEKTKLQVINSADITTMADLERLVALENVGLRATLLGRPLYEGKIDLQAAITRIKEQSASGMDEPTLIP